MSDETQQPVPEPTQSEPTPENPISETNPAPVSPQESMEQATIPTDQSNSAEAMEPTAHSKILTAQMAGNEPLTQKRKENLERANAKRQEKKREKINEILNLFSERQNITNDEVEKLLHVSDATATRYLETLEKEGKIKQVGKTGKHTHYEKI